MKQLFILLLSAAVLIGVNSDAAVAQAGVPSIANSAIVLYSDPAYKSIDTLQKAGIVIGVFGNVGDGPQNCTRFDYAISVARLMPALMGTENTIDGKGDIALQMQADLDAKLTRNKAALPALQLLVNEFTPELLHLGQDVAGINAHLAKLRVYTQFELTTGHGLSAKPGIVLRDKPFPDVPPNHWAFSAVETVRKAGIIQGYPSDNYSK